MSSREKQHSDIYANEYPFNTFQATLFDTWARLNFLWQINDVRVTPEATGQHCIVIIDPSLLSVIYATHVYCCLRKQRMYKAYGDEISITIGLFLPSILPRFAALDDVFVMIISLHTFRDYGIAFGLPSKQQQRHIQTRCLHLLWLLRLLIAVLYTVHCIWPEARWICRMVRYW